MPGGVVLPGNARTRTHSCGSSGVPDNNMLSQKPLCLSQVHAVIHSQTLSGRAVCDTPPALRGCPCALPPYCACKSAPILSPPSLPLLLPRPPPPSTRWYRPPLLERESAVVGCRSLGEGRTQRLRTLEPLEPVSVRSLLLSLISTWL